MTIILAYFYQLPSPDIPPEAPESPPRWCRRGMLAQKIQHNEDLERFIYLYGFEGWNTTADVVTNI